MAVVSLKVKYKRTIKQQLNTTPSPKHLDMYSLGHKHTCAHAHIPEADRINIHTQ